MPVHSEEERRRKAMMQSKIAQSQASANPIQQAAAPLQAQVQQKGPSPIAQIGQKVAQGALSSALGPLGGFLGGLFNKGGKVDYAEEARKRVAAQNAAIKAGAQGQQVAPATRVLFNEAGKQIGQVPGDVIKGYAGRAKQGATAGLEDTYAGISKQIQAAKAAGQPVDYNALAALQQARQSGNAEKERMAMQAFLQKHPQFRIPGASQGVVKRVKKNMGGPISANPYGYNEGGQAQATPIKKVMDMEKLESQKSMDSLKEQQAERAFIRGESRKDEAHQQAMAQKEEAHQQAMKLKKESAMMGPLAKKEN